MSKINLLKQAFLDGDKGSFGRIFSMPFLLSAWVLGTTYGVIQLVKGEGITDIVILLFSIAAALYGGSKGLSIVKGVATNAKTRMGLGDGTGVDPGDGEGTGSGPTVSPDSTNIPSN